MKHFSFLILGTLLLTNSWAAERGILKHQRPVPNSYIVILNPVADADLDSAVHELTRQFHVRLSKRPNDNQDSILRYAMQGFTGTMSAEDALALAQDSRVAAVEQDAFLSISSETRQLTAGQSNLDRLDQSGAVSTNGDNQYTYTTTGRGVYIYIFDSGVERNHIEFDNDNSESTPNFFPRVLDGVTFASDGQYPAYQPCGGMQNIDDGQYPVGTHGTAVASVAAGKTVGVAKNAYVVPVRIFSCSGTSTLQYWCWGMDWVAGPNNPYPKRPAVLNASVFVDQAILDQKGDPTPLSSFQSTINNVIAAGITVVASANNQGNSDCATTPAVMGYGNSMNFVSPYHVITVGGTDERDKLWRCADWNECFGDTIGSNTGQCVDIYAPAHNLKVAWNRDYSAYREDATQKSGTSFAAPLVAGVAARLLEANPNLSPQQVWQAIQDRALGLESDFDRDGVPTNNRIVHIEGYE
ncbi:MAG TPA: S8 family serine peptidase [Terriglobales bacterium]